MKKVLFAILVFTSFISCKDKEVTIIPNTNPLETIPQTFKQNILLESMLGEWNDESVNATNTLESFRAQSNYSIFVANFHTNDWLEIPQSEEIKDFLGGYIGIPKASINRKPGINTNFNENNYVWLSQINWEASIKRAQLDTPKIAISLESKFENQVGSINIYVAHHEAIAGDTRFVVYAVEDSIKNVFQSGATSNFYHQSVVKDVLPSLQGDTINLNEEFPLGTIRKKTISNIDLSKLNISKLRFIAFLYVNNSDFKKRTILNVQEVKFGGTRYWN